MQEVQETWVQPLDWKDSLEEGMTTYPSILAWRIPWTEELGGLTSTWSQSRTRLSNQHTFLKEKREQMEGAFFFLSSPNGLSWGSGEADVMEPRGQMDRYTRNRKQRQNESTVFNAFPPDRPFRIKGKRLASFLLPSREEGEGRSSGWKQHREGGPGLLGGLDLGRGVPQGTPGG